MLVEGLCSESIPGPSIKELHSPTFDDVWFYKILLLYLRPKRRQSAVSLVVETQSPIQAFLWAVGLFSQRIVEIVADRVALVSHFRDLEARLALNLFANPLMHIVVIITDPHEPKVGELPSMCHQIYTQEVANIVKRLIVVNHPQREPHDQNEHESKSESIAAYHAPLRPVLWFALDALVVLKHVVQTAFLVAPLDPLLLEAPCVLEVTLERSQLGIFDVQFDANLALAPLLVDGLLDSALPFLNLDFDVFKHGLLLILFKLFDLMNLDTFI